MLEHKTTARVILSENCNERCKYCCNKHKTIRKQMQPLSTDMWPVIVHNYSTICLTGGEIFLKSVFPLLMHTLVELRTNLDYKGFIYLYTQYFVEDLWSATWRFIDGIQYSIHNKNGTQHKLETITSLEKVNLFLSSKGKKSTQLWVHPDIDETLPIVPKLWGSIKRPKRLMEDGEYCLPENEDLFRFHPNIS